MKRNKITPVYMLLMFLFLASGASGLSVSDVRVVEGNYGLKQAVFNLSLDQPSTLVTQVLYTFQNQGATAGTDYIMAPGGVIINPGEIAARVVVMVIGDTLPEADEQFSLVVTKINGILPTISDDPVGQATIIDDDTPVLFRDDFTDNQLTWTVKGSWSEASGSLTGTGKALIPSASSEAASSACLRCSVDYLWTTAGGAKSKILFYGWYFDNRNNVQAQYSPRKGTWVLKRIQNGVVTYKSSLSHRVALNELHQLTFVYSGRDLIVSLNGSRIFGTSFSDFTAGGFGAGARNTTVGIDYLRVQ